MSNVICIELGDKDPILLKFKLRNTPLASRWLEKWKASRVYQLDDPKRFYGFNSVAEEIARAEHDIVQCINVINDYQPIIEKPFTSVYDQDCLNYLHNIFERYHGLLEQQTHDFWIHAPVEVQKALAQLNVCVHRCETAASPQQPRFVCTWYGLPKNDTLTLDEMTKYGSLTPAFGTMCFCYTEIGKTLEDLTHDNDNYIADEAFRPFNHYSVDFVVRLFDTDSITTTDKILSMKKYHESHSDFFYNRKLNDFADPRLLPLRFPFADLVEDRPREQLMNQIKDRQYITKVYLE